MRCVETCSRHTQHITVPLWCNGVQAVNLHIFGFDMVWTHRYVILRILFECVNASIGLLCPAVTVVGAGNTPVDRWVRPHRLLGDFSSIFVWRFCVCMLTYKVVWTSCSRANKDGYFKGKCLWILIPSGIFSVFSEECPVIREEDALTKWVSDPANTAWMESKFSAFC